MGASHCIADTKNPNPVDKIDYVCDELSYACCSTHDQTVLPTRNWIPMQSIKAPQNGEQISLPNTFSREKWDSKNDDRFAPKRPASKWGPDYIADNTMKYPAAPSQTPRTQMLSFGGLGIAGRVKDRDFLEYVEDRPPSPPPPPPPPPPPAKPGPQMKMLSVPGLDVTGAAKDFGDCFEDTTATHSAAPAESEPTIQKPSIAGLDTSGAAKKMLSIPGLDIVGAAKTKDFPDCFEDTTPKHPAAPTVSEPTIQKPSIAGLDTSGAAKRPTAALKTNGSNFSNANLAPHMTGTLQMSETMPRTPSTMTRTTSTMSSMPRTASTSMPRTASTISTTASPNRMSSIPRTASTISVKGFASPGTPQQQANAFAKQRQMKPQMQAQQWSQTQAQAPNPQHMPVQTPESPVEVPVEVLKENNRASRSNSKHQAKVAELEAKIESLTAKTVKLKTTIRETGSPDKAHWWSGDDLDASGFMRANSLQADAIR